MIKEKFALKRNKKHINTDTDKTTNSNSNTKKRNTKTVRFAEIEQ